MAAQMVVSLADPTVEMMVSNWAEKTVGNLADEKADHLVGKWVVEMVGQTGLCLAVLMAGTLVAW